MNPKIRGWSHGINKRIREELIAMMERDGYSRGEICRRLGWFHEEIKRRLDLCKQIGLGDAALIAEAMGYEMIVEFRRRK